MRTSVSSRLVAFFVAVLASTWSSASDFDYCLLCHGGNGNGNVAIRAPKIAGMEPWYIARQLEAFASGLRGTNGNDAPGQEMRPIGIRLKEEGRIEDAVRFVQSLSAKEQPATITADVTRGRELYETCASCHGARGEGNASLHAPALASRSDWYLIAQLQNYKSGQRGSDPRDTHGAQMRAIAATLPDDRAIADVIAYINTLN